MNIMASQFNGLEFDELLTTLKRGEAVETEFYLVFEEDGGRLLVSYVVDPEETGSTDRIGDFDLDPEGLKEGILAGCEHLERFDYVDGFQIENDDGECYDRESFEVLALDIAKVDLEEIAEAELEETWRLSIIEKGGVEDPSMVR